MAKATIKVTTHRVGGSVHVTTSVSRGGSTRTTTKTIRVK